MSNLKADLSINVDPTNPGQFFACCGLLELADRLGSGSEGWFESSPTQFSIRAGDSSSMPDSFLKILADPTLDNTMTEGELARLREFKSKRVKDLTTSKK